jgi:hypothetical protein
MVHVKLLRSMASWCPSHLCDAINVNSAAVAIVAAACCFVNTTDCYLYAVLYSSRTASAALTGRVTGVCPDLPRAAN